jgi:hypothetical protein
VVFWHITLPSDTLRCLLEHYTVFWHITLSSGTLRCLLTHYALFWHTALSSGTLRCLLAHCAVFWHIALSSGLLCCILAYEAVFWHIRPSSGILGFLWHITLSSGTLRCLLAQCAVFWHIALSCGTLGCLAGRQFAMFRKEIAPASSRHQGSLPGNLNPARYRRHFRPHVPSDAPIQRGNNLDSTAVQTSAPPSLVLTCKSQTRSSTSFNNKRAVSGGGPARSIRVCPGHSGMSFGTGYRIPM